MDVVNEPTVTTASDEPETKTKDASINPFIAAFYQRYFLTQKIKEKIMALTKNKMELEKKAHRVNQFEELKKSIDWKYSSNSMINKTIWLGLFIGLSLPVFSLSIQSEVMNQNSSPIIETNVGINSKFKLFIFHASWSIEYTKFNQYGTVHVPINSKFISKQEQWSIPLSFYTGISRIPKLFIGGIIGMRLFSNT